MIIILNTKLSVEKGINGEMHKIKINKNKNIIIINNSFHKKLI